MIPDIKILQQEVTYLRNKLKAASKMGSNQKNRRKKLKKKFNSPQNQTPERLTKVNASGNTNQQQGQFENQGVPADRSYNTTSRPQESPISDKYSKESEKWNPSEVDKWEKQLDVRINSVSHGSAEEKSAVMGEIAWQNDGIVMNLITNVRKDPTGRNIDAVLKHLEMNSLFGGERSIASLAWEAIGDAALKRLKASYIIYKAMKQPRYFDDLLNDLQAAEVLGCAGNPVENKIRTEIFTILSSGKI
jgi:hypothetical protein